MVAICGRQKNGPKDVHTQISGTCEYTTLHGKPGDKPVCCQGEERETQVSGRLELPGKFYTLEIIKHYTRDSPLPPLHAKSPLLSFCQHTISWFATHQTSLILTGSLILPKTIKVRGTSYYTNTFLVKNTFIFIISPNPYSYHGKNNIIHFI